MEASPAVAGGGEPPISRSYFQFLGTAHFLSANRSLVDFQTRNEHREPSTAFFAFGNRPMIDLQIRNGLCQILFPDPDPFRICTSIINRFPNTK